jgi:hypothetical protein
MQSQNRPKHYTLGYRSSLSAAAAHEEASRGPAARRHKQLPFNVLWRYAGDDLTWQHLFDCWAMGSNCSLLRQPKL